MKYLLLFSLPLLLAACGGDGGISASGGGTVATEGSSITQVDVVPASSKPSGACSVKSREEGVC